MSLLLLEGFDDGLSTQRVQTGGPGPTGLEARTGSLSMGGTATYVFGASEEHATFVVGFALRMNAAIQWNVLSLWGDGQTVEHIRYLQRATGRIEILHGSGSLLGQTDLGVLTLGAWHYIELYVTLSDTVGVVKLRVDGKTPPGWSDLTNVDTKNGGTGTVFDTVSLAAGGSRYMDDLYILNGAGSVNNDLLGDIRVETLYPNGNGNYSQLTGSDGNSVDNYQQVDEAAPSSSDYNGSPTDGNKDTYAFEDLAATVDNVYGVMVSMWAAKSDTGTKSCRAVARRSAVDAVGDDKTLQVTYEPHDQVWDQDPTDSTTWTPAKVNAMEFGFEVRP